MNDELEQSDTIALEFEAPSFFAIAPEPGINLLTDSTKTVTEVEETLEQGTHLRKLLFLNHRLLGFTGNQTQQRARSFIRFQTSKPSDTGRQKRRFK